MKTQTIANLPRLYLNTAPRCYEGLSTAGFWVVNFVSGFHYNGYGLNYEVLRYLLNKVGAHLTIGAFYNLIKSLEAQGYIQRQNQLVLPTDGQQRRWAALYNIQYR